MNQETVPEAEEVTVLAEKVITKEEFERLPKWEQRVMIAQDVINRLDSSFYQASHTYILLPVDSGIWATLKLDVKSNFDRVKGCYVCAWGACMMSAVFFKNTLTFDDVRDIDDAAPRLLESVFSRSQLYLIEMAYERGSVGELGSRRVGRFRKFVSHTLGGAIRAKRFGNNWGGDNFRMKAIMLNIIRNKGTFIP